MSQAPSSNGSAAHSSTAAPALDAYGFPVPGDEATEAARRRCEAAAEELRPKWTKLRQLLSTGQAREDKVKKYCRRGVPVEHRPFVWMAVSGASARRSRQVAGYFQAMTHKGEVDSEVAHQIELDLPRTFPGHAFVASAAGRDALRRVLLAFSVHRPEVGYCQGMNYLAAMLLCVVQHRQEDAFWLLATLIDDGGILYQGMFAQNLVGAQVEMRSLEELVAAKLPRVHAKMAALHCDMTIVATDWFICLFATALPSETMARVWDALFSEGPKILYRVALVLLKDASPEVLATDNTGDLIQAIKASCHTCHDRDALMKKAFDKVGSMPMARITGFREENQEVVDGEVRRREERRNSHCTSQGSGDLSANSAPASPPASPANNAATSPKTSLFGFGRARRRSKLSTAGSA